MTLGRITQRLQMETIYNLELPALGQPAFAERVADIHGRAPAAVAGNLHTD
jgi:hypothetical protein